MTTFIAADRDGEEHLRRLLARGLDVKVVPAGTDKATVLDGFARALDLPDWFGGNWDALLDCLREIDGTGGRPVELVWDGTADLQRTDPRTYATVIGILEQVADERDDLHVTVLGRPATDRPGGDR